MASESDLSKLQAVKELIFGQEIQNYDAEFKEINNRFNRVEEKSRSDAQEQLASLATLEKTIMARLDKMENEFTKKMAQLEDKKTDRAKLGKLLIQIGEKLQDK